MMPFKNPATLVPFIITAFLGPLWIAGCGQHDATTNPQVQNASTDADTNAKNDEPESANLGEAPTANGRKDANDIVESPASSAAQPGTSQPAVAEHTSAEQRQAAPKESGEKLVGESVSQYEYDNEKKFLPGKEFTIESLERRNSNDGTITFTATCNGTKKQKLMLIISFTSRKSDETAQRKLVLGGPPSESRNGQFTVATRPIDVSTLTGKGEVYAFLMPHELVPNWATQKGDVRSLSNLFKIIITFGN